MFVCVKQSTFEEVALSEKEQEGELNESWIFVEKCKTGWLLSPFLTIKAPKAIDLE